MSGLGLDPALTLMGGGTPPADWAQSMFDAPVSNDPYITLRRKLAADRKASLDRKRQADDAVLPLVIQDSKDAAAREQAIMQRIDLAMSSLNGPPPQFAPKGMNEGETLTGLLQAIIDPSQLNQTLQVLQMAAGQRDEREFDNVLRAYGLNRETVKMTLQQLMGQLEDEKSLQRDLRKTEYGIRAQSAKSEDEINAFYDDAERDIEALSVKYGIEQDNLKKELEAQRAKALLEAETERKKIARDAAKDKYDAENQKRDDARADRQLNETIRHNKASEGTAAKREDRIAKSEIGGKSFFTPSDLKSVQKQIITARANLKAAEAEQRTKGGSAWDKIVSRVSGKPQADSAKVAAARAKLEALENELAGMRGEGPANPFDFDPGLKDKVKPGEPYKDAKGIWRQR